MGEVPIFRYLADFRQVTGTAHIGWPAIKQYRTWECVCEEADQPLRNAKKHTHEDGQEHWF